MMPKIFFWLLKKSLIGFRRTFEGESDMARSGLKGSRSVKRSLENAPTPEKSELKKKVRDALKNALFKDADDLVDVSDGPDDSIHIVIVSHKFNGRRLKDRDKLIWSVLTQDLRPAEWGRVSLSIGTTPEEIKAI
jgi:stress-induced morphogen